MRHGFALALLLFATLASATPTDDVRNAEIAFAKAFADRDQAKFFSYVLDDAYFLGPKQTLNGKAEVVKQWSEFFKTPEAPFSWAPERVLVNAAGDLGLSIGPVRTPDGTVISYFSSVWRKQKDGSWKVAFDGPGYRICPPPAQAAVDEGFITTDDGVKLHYRKVGKGPAVIVPAGFIVFDDFKELADSFTVITYDMRNRGRSSRVEDLTKITIEHDLKDVEAVRRHFNLDRFSLIGYSYLGKMVALYAMDNPQRIERIVQLGPVEINHGTNAQAQQQVGNDFGAPEAAFQRLKELQAAGARETSPKEFCEAQAEVLKYRLVGDPSHASRVRSLCDLENEWPINFARHAQAHFGSILQLEVPAERVRALNVPVLTIHGTKDRNAVYAGGREWAATLPNARLLTVEGAAHQVWTHDPPRILGAIREFLKSGAWPSGAEKVTAP